MEPPEHPAPPTGIPDWESAPGPDGKSVGLIKICDFQSHVQAQHADTDIGFAKEYEEIRKYSEGLNVTNDQCQHPDNKHKNRYLNIMACK